LPTNLSYGTDTPSRIVRTRGGSAANVAVFAGAVAQQQHNKHRARLIAQVGTDTLGDQLVEALESSGVHPCVVRSGRTGSIVVIVSPDGERTMLTDRAAATELNRAPANWHEGVSVLHVPAYSLFSQPLSDAAQQCIEQAHEKNIAVSIDASSASLIKSFGVDKFRDLVHQLRPKIFFCNADEAEVMNFKKQPLGLEIVVIKAGARPTTVIENSVVLSVDVEQVDEIVDSTGAGDAFAAGFLTKFAEQRAGATSSASASASHDTYICVVAGHALARRVLRSPGATMDTP
jgi:sugar/nucleoside kinase (ribokinase family)